MRIVIGVVSALLIMTIVGVTWYATTPLYHRLNEALNATYKSNPSAPVTGYDRRLSIVNALWGSVAILAIVGAIIYMFMLAQEREYVTGRY